MNVAATLAPAAIVPPAALAPDAPSHLKVHIGRRVHFTAGYGGIDCDGVIVEVHGTPKPMNAQRHGFMMIVRDGDCRVDVILFDGRKLHDVHQSGIDRPGIGIKLRDRVHGLAMIEALHRAAAQKLVDDELAANAAARTRELIDANRVIEGPAPVFFWNGVKDARGAKLQKAFYSVMEHGSTTGKFPAGTVTIYASDYGSFSQRVRDCFVVENNSDTQIDYFEKDHIRVMPSHPLYAAVLAAAKAPRPSRGK